MNSPSTYTVVQLTFFTMRHTNNYHPWTDRRSQADKLFHPETKFARYRQYPDYSFSGTKWRTEVKDYNKVCGLESRIELQLQLAGAMLAFYKTGPLEKTLEFVPMAQFLHGSVIFCEAI